MNHEAVTTQRLMEGINRALERWQKSQEDFKRQCEEAHGWLRHNSATNSTPEWIADLNRRGGTAHSYIILSGHAFWEEHQLREGLRSLFHFAEQARMDMCLHEEAITAYEIGRKGSSREFSADHPALLAQKEFLTYCASAVGFKDTLRDIRHIYKKDQRVACTERIDRIHDACFKSQVGLLIGLLRNGLVHARLPSPVWSVTMKASSGDKKAKLASLFLLRDDLVMLREGHLRWCKEKWGDGGKKENQSWETVFQYSDGVCKHEDGLRDTISLTDLVAEHFRQLRTCYDSVLSLFDTSVADCEKDFQSLLDSACSSYA